MGVGWELGRLKSRTEQNHEFLGRTFCPIYDLTFSGSHETKGNMI